MHLAFCVLLEFVDEDLRRLCEQYGWLCAGYSRREIMAQLGRIEDPEEIHFLATKLCREKPRTKDAIAFLRRYRNASSGAGDVKALVEQISRLIRDYMVRHPATTQEQVHEALRRAAVVMDCYFRDKSSEDG
jgi:hypothetical protein